jgi:hypothetical protein
MKMNYHDGRRVELGDKVKLWQGCTGKVVCSIDEGQYSEDYKKEDWDYLRHGVLILSEEVGLIHYLEPESGFELISRESGE